METNLSLDVKNISKSFKIGHERNSTLFDYMLSFSKKKSFENLHVLKDITFSVKQGESLGIIGVNGCGKSTLLKLITKIYDPDHGSITINGKLTPFLEIGTGLNGELTARENIIIYGVLLGKTKAKMEQLVNTIAKFAEIENFLDTKLKNFSNGMNARLVFSTAVHMEPDIMLVDEILSVGDVNFQKKCIETFDRLKKQGKTIILVSHAIDYLPSFCNNILWLHEGSVKSFGEPKKVIDEYKKFFNQTN
ncbi:MAG: ABC transporter ATP-binding protein [Nitrosarchaeum sp.]|nr:ABC transporter ATP-binding protein [Nitrosarchaeum sp.]